MPTKTNPARPAARPIHETAQRRRPAAEPTASVIAIVEGQIKDSIDGFLQDARMADKMFMRDVLVRFDSAALNRESEMCLPAAFEELARNRSMIVLEEDRGNEVLFFWRRFHQEPPDCLESAVLKFLDSASDDDRDLLEWFLETGTDDFHGKHHVRPLYDALENYTGCTSPAEQFVLEVLRGYSRGDYSPDDAAEDIKDFRENFDDSIALARRMMTRYPGILSIAEQEQKAETGSGHPEQAG